MTPSSKSSRSRTFGGQRVAVAHPRAPAVASCTSSSFSLATPVGSGNGGNVVLLREREPRFVGDLERVLEHVGPAGKARRDFRRALEIQAAVVVHPVGVAAILSEADAEQHVVRVVVRVAQEVRVVRRDDRKPSASARRENALVELRWSLRVVRLDLEIVAVLETFGVPRAPLRAPVEPLLEQVRARLRRPCTPRRR